MLKGFQNEPSFVKKYQKAALMLVTSVRHVKIRKGYVTTRISNMKWCWGVAFDMENQKKAIHERRKATEPIKNATKVFDTKL